jgi:AmmeMemoRadiSam system protein A
MASGDDQRVVGYGAVVFTKGPAQADTAVIKAVPSDTLIVTAPLTADDKRSLLAFARKTIDWFLTSRTTPMARGFSPSAIRHAGCFVTLKKNGELRGCIGNMAGTLPLARTVGAMAWAAAFEDNRFQPVERNELAGLTIEISMLTPQCHVPAADSIRVGTDGVVIRKGGRSAVFLPQVATEQGWTRDEMLGHLCRKAGLPEDAWRSGAEFYTFQAVVFAESDFPSKP